MRWFYEFSRQRDGSLQNLADNYYGRKPTRQAPEQKLAWDGSKVTLPLGEFFDTVAYRKRGTFLFRAIGTATKLANS